MAKGWFLRVFIFIPFFTQCNFLNAIPVIGMGPNGFDQVMVPQQEYTKRLTAITSSVQDSALPALSETVACASTGWKLRVLSLGISVAATVGIGPYQVGATPRFRIMFTNNLNPTLP